MAKIEKSKLKKGKADDTMPFERQNYIIIGVGLVSIVLGYLALSSGGVEGFMPLTLAPILLVLGYCVIVPIGIMYRKKTQPIADSASAGQAVPTK
ncbi:MAG TPA: hypothetical protein VKS81_10715 [Bacteroidota bacterium]|nr:hypothetical protein [Bacteroidota bacterium]